MVLVAALVGWLDGVQLLLESPTQLVEKSQGLRLSLPQHKARGVDHPNRVLNYSKGLRR
jgi:hypothetical protein